MRPEEGAAGGQHADWSAAGDLRLLEFAGVAHLTTDAYGTVLAANEAAGGLLAVQARFLAGKPLASPVDLRDRKRFRQLLLELQQGADHGELDTLLAHLARDCERLVRLAALLTLARAQGGHEQPRLQPIELRPPRRALRSASAVRGGGGARRVPARAGRLDERPRASSSLLRSRPTESEPRSCPPGESWTRTRLIRSPRR